MTLKEAMQDRAKKYAEKAHKGQVRKIAGEEYVEHPKRVAEIVRRFKSSHKIDNLISAALLHDTIEDTGTTEEDLHKLFGGLTASLVKELTSDKEAIEKTGKADYLADKMKNMSSWALVIKLADRLDNVSDLKAAMEKKPEFAEKYAAETKSMLAKLKSERKLTNTQQKIVDAIYKKLEELKLNEAFLASSKKGEEYYEVFVNPTSKEIRSILRDGRYRAIIDVKNKKVYAFNPDILHYQVIDDGLTGIRSDAYLKPKREFAFVIPIFKNGKNYIYRPDLTYYLKKEGTKELEKQDWFNTKFEVL